MVKMRSGAASLLCAIGIACILKPQAVNAGAIYASNYQIGIGRFSTLGGNSIFPAPSVGRPTGMAFDMQGNLYVAGWGNVIAKITPGGVASTFSVTVGTTVITSDGPRTTYSTGLNLPIGLAIDAAGNVYAANYGNNTIEKFGPDGIGTLFASTGLNKPTGLALDHAGDLFVANESGTIKRITPQGAVFSFGQSTVDAPREITFDAAGNLYVASPRVNTITKFAPDGVASIFATDHLNSPYGLAFDENGNLYVSNEGVYDPTGPYANTIAVFTPAGVGSIFAASNLNAPVYLTAQVPEPTVGALLAIALPMLLLRRARDLKS